MTTRSPCPHAPDRLVELADALRSDTPDLVRVGRLALRVGLLHAPDDQADAVVFAAVARLPSASDSALVDLADAARIELLRRERRGTPTPRRARGPFEGGGEGMRSKGPGLA